MVDQNALTIFEGPPDENGVLVLAVEGELDLATAPQFSDALGVVTGRGIPVVLNLTGLSFIDSCGLTALLLALSGCATTAAI